LLLAPDAARLMPSPYRGSEPLLAFDSWSEASVTCRGITPLGAGGKEYSGMDYTRVELAFFPTEPEI
jgi:hypothetical protein